MKKIIITGANRGIGLELAHQLASRGDSVTALCRRSADALHSLGVRVIEEVDVCNPVALDRLSCDLDEARYDWLINNAGILVRDTLESLDFEAMERQFRVNALGPLRVTAALLSKLGRGSKIGIVTSRMGSIDDNTSGAYYGYRMSKAAVNIAGKSLSVDLAGRGIAVGILHPGMVATDMTGGTGVPVEKAARGIIARMDELTLETSGTFWHAEGEVLPW
jgi:NAD(P)-dependent dehydrogenase (short-subunit alcohol dehydrogenase family)